MLLGNLIKSAGKKYKKKYVENICFDSRKVKKNDIFFAIEGNKISGTKNPPLAFDGREIYCELTTWSE